MPWNWQLSGWPEFHFDSKLILEKEKQFFLNAGSSLAYLKKLDGSEQQQFIVEILSAEGELSSRIEGEILDRKSLQSSIKRCFGLTVPVSPKHAKEAGMAKLLCDMYETFDLPLSHQMLGQWHKKLFEGFSGHILQGAYRDHEEPMQIISHRLDRPYVFFEAPPSDRVHGEMEGYLEWFNSTSKSYSVLARAAIAHLRFENIHPFEDGNGRIGRALIEKSLSQGVGQPALIAVSKVLSERKKEYYSALEGCNRSLDASHWVVFFADAVLQAQEESLRYLNFIIEKAKLMTRLQDKLNERQEKALIRLFQEGPNGFDGGLSAEKYRTITKTSRATATRDLTELLELNALHKTGTLRHTRYWLNF